MLLLSTKVCKPLDVRVENVVSIGVTVAVKVIEPRVVGFHAHVAVAEPYPPVVFLERQFEILLLLAKKRTFPGVFTLMVIVTEMPL